MKTFSIVFLALSVSFQAFAQIQVTTTTLQTKANLGKQLPGGCKAQLTYNSKDKSLSISLTQGFRKVDAIIHQNPPTDNFIAKLKSGGMGSLDVYEDESSKLPTYLQVLTDDASGALVFVSLDHGVGSTSISCENN